MNNKNKFFFFFLIFLTPLFLYGFKSQNCKSIFESKKSFSKFNLKKSELLMNFKNILDTDDPGKLQKAYKSFKTNLLDGVLALKSLSKKPRKQDWFKDTTEYMFYVDQFGVNNEEGNFYNVKKMIPYLKDLGVEILYPLPFLESPRLDAGFDVKDYFKVDKRYGGMLAFREFAKEAKKNGMYLKMDLVLNHISDDHKWFKAFLNGNMKYKDYFIVRDSPPEIVNVTQDTKGKLITYREVDEQGKESLIQRRLIFPGFSSSHYRKVSVNMPGGGTKKFWVYHTFYPSQIDLNFKNPNVFSQVYKIINFWINEGIDIFRLDAIPFLDKTRESSPRVFEIVKNINYYIQELSPESIIMVEAAQEPDKIIKYLGADRVLGVDNTGSVIKRTDHAQMAYGFTQMMYTWGAILKEDSEIFRKGLIKPSAIPSGSSVSNFLRVHDELSLEMLYDNELRKFIHDFLVENNYGISFRDGLGVAGRLADFLNNDKRRIILAFSLLMSQPGVPVIYYGDDIAAKNNINFANKQAIERQNKMNSKGVQMLDAFDARDVGRGSIDFHDFENARYGGSDDLPSAIFGALKKMIQVRKNNPQLRRGDLRLIDTNSTSVLAYERNLYGYPEIVVISNMSGKELMMKVEFDRTTCFKNLLDGKQVGVIDGKIKLDPYQTMWLMGRFTKTNYEENACM